MKKINEINRELKIINLQLLLANQRLSEIVVLLMAKNTNKRIGKIIDEFERDIKSIPNEIKKLSR